ncbi:MAG: adenylosuccinate lyase [Candidatus Acetothermia bacterium]|jgi:adenylosuccinate lyase|nr:adenylosuccinate lyase [Candidatus Acetothermia bacterium]MDH7505519.1 adenylosuccinate lyase [Candidatus Acetothermia bacterium]
MIERYSLSPMRELWTEEAEYGRWLEVELAAVAALAELGAIPAGAAEAISRRARLEPELIRRSRQIEREIGHDLLAFIWALEERVGPEGRFLHKGLTSSDVKDTALAMAMRAGLAVLIDELKALLAVLADKAREYKTTLMVGRTHGVHAEPTTFGLKLLNFYYELERDLARLEEAREAISYGKASGAVGTYAHIEPRAEELICRRLGLKPAKVSDQVIARDRHAQALAALALLGAGLERLAVEIRNLSRTEIAEVHEGLPHGSSSMPHKRNPIASETVSGLARLLRANLQAALENITLWHERDISHSSVERVIIPDSFMAAHWMVRRMREVLENLVVDPARMRENLELTRGAIFSQAVLLKLVEKGLPRRRAHELVQQLSARAEREGRSLKELLLEDETVRAQLGAEEIEALFDHGHYLRHVEEVFARFTPDLDSRPAAR